MFFRFRHTSPWAGGVFKAFFYTSPPLAGIEDHPPRDTAVSSYTRPQLEALVRAGKEALAAWPDDA